jgi:HlyD family secretion protein
MNIRKKKSKKFKVFALLILIAATALGIFFLLKQRKLKAWRLKIDEQVTVVERRNLKKELVLTGKVLPSSAVDVYSPSSGTLTELFIKEGDFVKKGAQLFSVLQDTNGRQELESLRNEVSRSRLELKSSEENLERRSSVKDLFSENENAKLEDEVNRKQLEYSNSRERLALLEEKLGISKSGTKAQSLKSGERKIFMTAPADGIVTYILKNVGESVFGTTESTNAGGREILTISNTEKMIVRSRVLEADLSSVKLGMSVSVKMDAFQNKDYVGKLSRISQQGIEDKNAGYTYFVMDVEIEKPDADVRSNMNATLNLVLAEAQSVLSLPISSVATLGKHSVVQLVPQEPSDLKYKPVQIGLVTDKWVELKEPVSADEPKEGDKFVEIDFAKLDLAELGEGTLRDGNKSKGGKAKSGSKERRSGGHK